MISLMRHVQGQLNRQYSRPEGIMGRLAGRLMLRQHEPEIRWTLSQLNVQPTDQVLEIGFGVGRAIELLAPMSEHVSGIDLSATMVSIASYRNAQFIRAGKVDVRCGDVTALPFEDARFDKIFSVHTLYFWPDYSQAIAEIARVLKPRGMVVLTFSPGTEDKDGIRRISGFRAVVEERVLPIMQNAGFTSAYLKDGPNSRQYLTVALVSELARE